MTHRNNTHLHPNADLKGPRTMGASRDFTTGNETGTATALLERTPRSRTAQVSAPTRPARPSRRGVGTGAQPTAYRRRQTPGRLGSKQVVSVRGRRTQPLPATTKLPQLSFISLALLIGGVVLAMWLSGQSTVQTFQIQGLVAQERQLDNQIETLNRDLENVRSSADVARRAADADMGVPVQPGIIEAKDKGKPVVKRRPAPETDRIVDINGSAIRPGKASSDPKGMGDISDEVSAIPEGQRGATDGARDAANDGRGTADRAGSAEAGQGSEQLPYAPSVSQ